MSLKAKYANDPELLEFYKKNFIKPGWAGELDRDELEFIKSQLQSSRSLRRLWGLKRISEKHIRAVARDGVRAIQRRVLASEVGEEKLDKGDKYWREKALLHTDENTNPRNRLNLQCSDRELSQRPAATLTDIQGPHGGKKSRRCLPLLFY